MAKQSKLPLTDLVTVMFKFIPNRVVRPDLQNVTVALDMIESLDSKHLKMLWDIEHLFNSLPSVTRVHVAVEEQKTGEPVQTDWHQMIEGKRYRVRYRIAGVHRADHEFVGTYLGDESGRPERVAQFSLRPVSGTSTLAHRCIVEVTEMPKTVPHSNPKRVTR